MHCPGACAAAQAQVVLPRAAAPTNGCACLASPSAPLTGAVPGPEVGRGHGNDKCLIRPNKPERVFLHAAHGSSRAIADRAKSAIWVLLIRRRTFRSSRCVISGLAAGVADQVGGRRRPVFGLRAGTLGPGRRRDRRPGLLRPTQEQHKFGAGRRPTREQHGRNGIPRHTLARVLKSLCQPNYQDGCALAGLTDQYSSGGIGRDRPSD
jgi:hypothetical protein